jgi:osmotically-inducible protein OsmY
MNLTGCVFGAFAGGGAAGGSVAADNRDIGQQTQDQSLQQKIGNLIYKDQDLHDNTHISITVYEGNVLLAGQAKTESVREKAEKYTYSVEGVKHVYNQITLGEPISTWTQTQDAWITTKVKSALVGTSGLRAAHIKVVTDNSIVYLFGRVNQEQANLAARAASQVEGVHQVVTLFRDPSTNAGVTTNPS